MTIKKAGNFISVKEWNLHNFKLKTVCLRAFLKCLLTLVQPFFFGTCFIFFISQTLRNAA